MTDKFLKLNKDLWKLKLNANKQQILSYIMEFDKNTGDCFISDETFSMYLNTSKSTVSREIKALEQMGYLIRNTKNVKGGKERHLKVNQKKIEEDISNVNLSLVAPQQSKCLLSNVNLPIDNKQNDLIKDKLKDNLKDNKEILSTDVDKISYEIPEVEEVKDGSRVEKAIPIAKEEVKKMIESGSTYRQLKGQLFIIDNLYYQVSNI